MSWLERQFGQKSSSQENSEYNPQAIKEQMSPGLTAEYDWSLREKAGVHQPPPPPEHMGLEGEYDEEGLVKRVAAAFDKESELADIETVYIAQKGSTLVLKGSVPSQAILNKLKEVAAKVDGTKLVMADFVEELVRTAQ